METLEANQEGIAHAVALLQQGKLVAFPTETVYGLGADAANPDAVRKIFAAKGRPADHPLIVHLPNADCIRDWARDIPDSAWRLAEQFWPGPMALVLKKADPVSDIITGGQNTIGLRVPSHPVARELLATFDGALAAPSANRFGRISPTTAKHVLDEFDQDEHAVAAVIDSGQCPVGVESTIIDVTGEQPQLLRPGMISVAEIEQVLGQNLIHPVQGIGPRASGRLPLHYAPLTPMALLPIEAIQSRLSQSKSRTGVLALHEAESNLDTHHWQVMPSDPQAYAHQLYAELRKLDQLKFDQILVEQPPLTNEWDAVNDRLQRAAHHPTPA